MAQDSNTQQARRAGKEASMAATSTASDFRRCPHHSTDDATGYEVRQTIANDGKVLGLDGPIISTFMGRNPQTGLWQYGEALEAAKAIRARRKAYAVVDTVYVCGHTSRDHR